ncbi:MAG: threonylcarbamoyl-AMP synthase [Candidatus Kerfeldbacteria bacterium]|nr:threonylcarbamoyl-AMP synthase [Candidatus Kerfeldbacteria bacterium]
MDIVRLNLSNPEKNIIEQAAAVLKQGGVVAYPTDTAYGLAADALNENAIGKLFIIKQRVQKPLPVIVDSVTMLKKIARVSAAEKKIMDAYWPGAVTIIFDKVESVPPFLTLGLPTVGVRIPDLQAAQMLVKAAGSPITSTSANLSGKGNCYSAECVLRMFQANDAQPDLILDAGDLPEVPVSTVVRLENGKITIIRQGPVKVRGAQPAKAA